ncbi:MAG: TfuA domain-containing protein [Kofleriaceae bacterium]
MTTLVFVGPTLPAVEVTARLPGAEVLPPVAVGDVLTLARSRRRITRIAIIDGYFERMAAVWHKEILCALERGIAVWGAASMGALRAAELAPFGMIGVGSIYRAFASGELIADDEVAVAHLPAEYGYAATSDALVDLRDGIARAAPNLRTQHALVELARVRFYRERTWAQLLEDARVAGLPRRQIETVAGWRRTHPRHSRKADDARLLLRRLATTPPTRPRKIAVPRTWALRRLEADLDR